MYENEPKWGDSQAGRHRPGRLAYPCEVSSCDFVNHGPEHMIKSTQRCFRQNSQVKTERLEPSKVGPNSDDGPKILDPNRLEEQFATWNQRARAAEARTKSEPGRPA